MITLIKLILLFLLLSNCASVPNTIVPRPWTKTYKKADVIYSPDNMTIIVKGKVEPLISPDNFRSNEIKESLQYLLERRGYKYVDQSEKYVFKINYNTFRKDKLNMTSVTSNKTSTNIGSLSSSLSANSSSVGVSLAETINFISSQTSSFSSQSIQDKTSYTHTISIEMYDNNNSLLWNGESTWDAGSIDITNYIVPILQIILSDLPRKNDIDVQIKELKESHVENYYKINCSYRMFTCPAVPYPIYIYNRRSRESVPGFVNEPTLLPAYVDLIQTSELSLPNGDEDDWKDPLDIKLWTKVTLGGKYLLGKEKRPINVLITMKGQISGYFIDNCKVVSDEEYAIYEKKLNKWRIILNDFYNVYK